MKKSTVVLLLVLALLAVIASYYVLVVRTPSVTVIPVATSTPTLMASVQYACQNQYAITADYFETVVSTASSTPPTPRGSVHVSLSNGRVLDLQQTISASGVRYASEGESIVFWNKGNGVMLYEDGVEKDYRGCVAISAPIAGVLLPQVYVSTLGDFSLRLPSLGTTSADYTPNETFTYLVKPTVVSSGVAFTIPATIASGTNLAADTYLSLERMTTPVCEAAVFSDTFSTSTTIIDGDVTYSMATGTGAAAGNRYEETVYAFPGTNPCLAVRYVIHSGVFENYPTGTIKRFDAQALLTTFDHIRRSVVVNQ